ncbi:pectinesterase family protein [Streptomyces sp. QTS52]
MTGANGADVTWQVTSEPADARTTYAEAIKAIMDQVRGYQIEPRPGVRPVAVTNENGALQFVTIDLHAEDRPEFIRLFMRRSDAYIQGWRQGVVNGAGNVTLGNFFTLEAAAAPTLQDGAPNPARLPGSTTENTDTRHEGLATYTELERQGGISRVGMQITPASLNNGVLVLQGGANSSVRDVAQSLLRIIVAFAEGSRFLDQAAATATAFGNGLPYTVTAEHARQQNNWVTLSEEFFAWIAANWGNRNVNYSPALAGLMMAHYPKRGSTHRDKELLEFSTMYVAQDGFADHTTVQDAIDMVGAAGGGETRIIIDKGVYHEVISVPSSASFLTIESLTGWAPNVVIQNTRCHGMINPATGQKYGTQGSAVATFRAPNLTVKNITISNTFDRAAHPEVSPFETQAVAVAAMGDRQVFDNVTILGHQDTLLVKSETPTTQARQYFYQCFIRGDVDFIFGNATAVFHRSNIQVLEWPGGTVLAPNTDKSKKYGILIADSFINSTAPARTAFLGRPWHNGPDAWPQAVVRDTQIASVVTETHPWTDMTPDYPWSQARFKEYRNSGPGAGVGSNAPHMSDIEAREYTPNRYLFGTDAWNPVR